MPLCVSARRLARRLCWLGQELCDYNAPLLARDFSQRVPPEASSRSGGSCRQQMRCDPLLRYDWIEFEKMPQMVGAQINPFTFLGVTPNPSGAHLTHLGDDWEKFYTAKRSSATRRRDRAKRRHMSEFGEIRFVTATEPDETRRTLEPDGSKEPLVRAQRHCRHIRAAGIPRIFSRPRVKSASRGTGSYQPRRGWRHLAAANFGIVFGDCYYHVLASYDGGEIAHYGPGALHLRELMAYAIGLRPETLRFHHRRRAVQARMVRYRLELYDFAADRDLARLAGAIASTVRRRIKRSIKQTPWAWRLASRAGPPSARYRRRYPFDCNSRSCRLRTPRRKPSVVACIMGDMDLLRPLVLAGIPCAVVTRTGVPSLYSRYAQSHLVWDDCSKNSEGLVDALVKFGTAQSERPVLFYEEDAQVLLVSRHREHLAQAFRFVVAAGPLVEDCRQGRFSVIGGAPQFPGAGGTALRPTTPEPADLGLAFPLIVKPLTRLEPWNTAFGLRKAHLC